MADPVPRPEPAVARPPEDGRLPGDVHWYDLPDDEAEEDPY